MVQITSIYDLRAKKLGRGQKPIGLGHFRATVLIVDTLPVAHLEYLASEYSV
jgi:hypothetical protein